jgi:hypothetical protein
MIEDEARRLASAWLQSAEFSVAMTLGRAVEGRRAWIMELRSASNEVLFGNTPLRVDKGTGNVAVCPSACLEFDRKLSAMQRLRRWFGRRSYL